MSQLASWGKQQQWGAPLRWVIAVLLVVVLAYVLAQTVWLLWYGPSEPGEYPDAPGGLLFWRCPDPLPGPDR